MNGDVIAIDNTRKIRDGGRDAVGIYGDANNGIAVKFSLKAKCFKIDSCIGFKPLSRLFLDYVTDNLEF